MSNVAQLPAVQQVDTRYTQDVIPILDTSKFEHMQRIAAVMAECGYVPDHLRKGGTPSERTATCFLVVNQAVRWGMDPFALAQTTYVISGKLGFEGKTIAAAINSDPRLKGRLNYEYSGEGQNRTVVVSGTFRDTGETRTVEGTIAKWRTKNQQWADDPDQMLAYRGSRQWARRWMPDRLLGVYSADELDGIAERDVPTGHRAQRMKDITPPKPKPAPVALDLPDIPDEVPTSDQTSEAREAINQAISIDMLEHLREVFPDADWEALDKDYEAKAESLSVQQAAE